KGTTLSFKLPENEVYLDGENSNLFSESGYNWLRDNRMIASRFPFEQLAMAKNDVLRQLTFMPLDSLLEKPEVFFPANGEEVCQERKLLDYLHKNPQLRADLEDKLKNAGIPLHFRISGQGANGVFLEAGEEGKSVVIALRGELFRNRYDADKIRK